MYWTLMVRGLSRYRQTGKRLFVLLALCSAAVLFFLAFRDSFASQFQQLAIDVSTSHLQIVPANSPKLSPDGKCTDHRETLVLLRYSDDFRRFVHSIPAVRGSMLAVETKAALFTLEGEPTGQTAPLVGVDPQDLPGTLPGLAAVDGGRDMAWREGMPDVPVFRPPLETTEIVKDSDRFVRENFRPDGDAWTELKRGVGKDIPALFSPGGSADDAAFLAAMNAALDRADLPQLLQARNGGKYDLAVDDALAALRAASPPVSAAAGTPPARLRVLRKRLLQSVYPDAITPVRDSIELHARYTMTVPPARDMDPLARPHVLPVRLAGYVQRVPLFRSQYYVDARALRDRLGLEPTEGTNVYVRLASVCDMAPVKKTIEGWLAARGLAYTVQDYRATGKLFQSTSLAFQFISLILVVLFVATVAIFVANAVLLAVMRRRREIGTAIAIGFSPAQNVLVLFGEVMLIVLVSWAAGAVIAGGLALLFHQSGVPGIAVMQGSRLVVDLRFGHLVTGLCVLLVTSGLAALVPLRRLARAKPVDLLREAA